jgi:hypothetical protein
LPILPLPLAFQFRDPGLLRDQPCLPFSDQILGMSQHSFEYRRRMDVYAGAHVGYLT